MKPAAGCCFGVARPGQLRGHRIFFYRVPKTTLDTDGRRG